MEKKYNYDIVRADDTSALTAFYCGVTSMDNFIHDQENGLAKFIRLRLSNLWIVIENGKAVAFFALSKDALVLNNEDRQNIERKEINAVALPVPDDADKFWDKEKFPAFEIDYLAVCNDKRSNSDEHLGTFIVEEICRMADADIFSATLFLTVEALDTKEYSAVDFYKKCGFQFSDVAQNKYNYEVMFGNQPTTRRMFKLIIPVDNN